MCECCRDGCIAEKVIERYIKQYSKLEEGYVQDVKVAERVENKLLTLYQVKEAIRFNKNVKKNYHKGKLSVIGKSKPEIPRFLQALKEGSITIDDIPNSTIVFAKNIGDNKIEFTLDIDDNLYLWTLMMNWDIDEDNRKGSSC